MVTPLVDTSKSYSQNLSDIAEQVKNITVTSENVPINTDSKRFRQAIQKVFIEKN